MFFVLSSFLITELLLCEQDATGTVSLKKFYARRALRIWPLYYLGVGVAIAISVLFPQQGHLSGVQIGYLLLLFFGWMGGKFNDNPMGVLWSLSVEELYYLIWPWVTKARLVIAGAIVLFIASSITNVATSASWYNPLVQFFFFSVGSLAASALHGKRPTISTPVRTVLLFCGFACWPLSYQWHSSLMLFATVALGCILLLCSLYNIRPGTLPRWLLYLGRISFGLYVFHLTCYRLSYKLEPHLPVIPHVSFFVYMYGMTLLLSVVIASVSAKYFEAPFLRLKQRRFTIVRSHSESATPL